MKYEIEIPDGKYCEGCLMQGEVHEEPYCNFAGKELAFKMARGGWNGHYVKDKGCPNFPKDSPSKER